MYHKMCSRAGWRVDISPSEAIIVKMDGAILISSFLFSLVEWSLMPTDELIKAPLAIFVFKNVLLRLHLVGYRNFETKV